MSISSKTYPYRKARLVKSSNRWFINFGVYDCLKEKIHTKKYYKGINEIENLADRERFAKGLIRDINVSIMFWALNIPPAETKEIDKPKRMTLIDAIQYIVKLKYSNFTDTRKTSHTFTSNANQFLNFCQEKGYSHIMAESLQKKHVQHYIDYMVIEGKLSGQTIENRISSMRAIYNHLIKRNILESNPFSSDLDKPKIVKSKKNHAYSAIQINEIKEFASSNNLGIWMICQFIYYSYMRPVEIGRLKVENILLEQNQIFIPSDISKNKKEAYIFMPPALKNIMIEYLATGYPKKDFLFSKDFVPGQKAVGYNYFGNKFREITRKLNYQNQYTLYSWKHTGVVSAYKNGVDLKAIQMQCRHSSIEQTDTYLKSLGFVENESFRTGIPEI